MSKKRVLEICAKVRDNFGANLIENDKVVISGYDSYVPAFMPGNHCGDYIELNIDIDTGMILNWKKPTLKELKQLNKKS